MCVSVCACGSFLWLCLVFCFVMGYVLQSGEIAHKRVHYYYSQCSAWLGFPVDQQISCRWKPSMLATSYFNGGEVRLLDHHVTTQTTTTTKSFKWHPAISVPHTHKHTPTNTLNALHSISKTHKTKTDHTYIAIKQAHEKAQKHLHTQHPKCTTFKTERDHTYKHPLKQIHEMYNQKETTPTNTH